MSRIVESLYRVSDVEVTESLAELTPEQQLIYDVNASLMGRSNHATTLPINRNLDPWRKRHRFLQHWKQVKPNSMT